MEKARQIGNKFKCFSHPHYKSTRKLVKLIISITNIKHLFIFFFTFSLFQQINKTNNEKSFATCAQIVAKNVIGDQNEEKDIFRKCKLTNRK